MLQNFKSKEFLKFLLTGGFSAVINFSSRFIYNIFVSFELSIIFAYITGMITAFILFKIFVFKHSSNSFLKEVFWFIAINLVALIQTYYISILLKYYIFLNIAFNFYPEAIAHAIGIIFPVFTSFIGHKYLSFKSK
jgi:putative flippase GtrA